MKSSKLVKNTLEAFMTKRSKSLRIDEWHFSLDNILKVTLGLKDGSIGGPYSPPSIIESLHGEIFIRWKDGRISQGNISAEDLENFRLRIENLRKMSYIDEEAPTVLEPQTFPEGLKVKDQEVIDLVRIDSSYLFDMLLFCESQLRQKPYIKNIDGSAGALHSFHTVMNSKGLSAEWEATSMGIGIYVNGSKWDSLSSRKLIPKRKLKDILKEIDNYMIHSQTIKDVKSGIMPIILTPNVFNSFLGSYLLGTHLSGEALAYNKSMFSVEDFKSNKRVFDSKLNLIVDGITDYNISTSPCSSEGIPSGKEFLIANGRLIQPLLSLKYAQKLGFKPTVNGSVQVDPGRCPYYSQLVKKISLGVVVHRVLGMHTQDTSEGNYSLSVSGGLVVKEGEIKGTVDNITISGNFLDALKDEKTRFCIYRGNEYAMKTLANVTT